MTQQRAPQKVSLVTSTTGQSVAPERVAARSRRATDPLKTHAMGAYLARRSGMVTAAVQDLRTGKTWTYHPFDREQTGSIIKVDILETLLRQAELSGTALSTDTASLVQG